MRMAALARGEALRFEVQRGGRVVGEINASVDQQRLIETVLSLARRDRGEIPFVLEPSGAVHTVDAEAGQDREGARPRLQGAGGAPGLEHRDRRRLARGHAARRVGHRLRPRAADAGLAARHAPRVALDAGRRPAAHRRLVRRHRAARLPPHAPRDGADRRRPAARRAASAARGWRSSRATRSAISRGAFNGMAAELESHEQMLVQQERLRRELELCRQIQNEMLPHGLLKIGLTEVPASRSRPARSAATSSTTSRSRTARSRCWSATCPARASARRCSWPTCRPRCGRACRSKATSPAWSPSWIWKWPATRRPQVYLTLFVGILDPARKRAALRQRRPQPAVPAAARRPHRADGAERAPGGPDARAIRYEERSIEVGAGELLFLYTDGTVEVFNEAGDMFDADRLEQALVARVGREHRRGARRRRSRHPGVPRHGRALRRCDDDGAAHRRRHDAIGTWPILPADRKWDLAPFASYNVRPR